MEKQPCNTCKFTGNCPDEKNGRKFTTKLFGMNCWKPKPEAILPTLKPRRPTKKILSLDKIKALNKKALEMGLKPLYKVNEVVEPIPEGALPLFDADPNCKHDIVCAPGGGVKCTKCRGWFCF